MAFEPNYSHTCCRPANPNRENTFKLQLRSSVVYPSHLLLNHVFLTMPDSAGMLLGLRTSSNLGGFDLRFISIQILPIRCRTCRNEPVAWLRTMLMRNPRVR